MAVLQQQYHEMKLIEQRQQLRTQSQTMAAQPRVVVPVVVSKPQEHHELDIDPRSMPQNFCHLPSEDFEAEYDHTALSPAEAALVAKATAWAAMHDDDDDDTSVPQYPQQKNPQERTSIRPQRSTVSPRRWQPVSYEERSEVTFSLACACLRRIRLNDGRWAAG